MKEVKLLNNNLKFRLSDGRIALIPRSWVIINPSDAPFARTVCVIEVRNAPEGTPRFAVFADRPVCELDRDPDLDAIDAAIAETWPRYRDILDARVEPVFECGLMLKNYDEWSRAPRPGYFDLGAWPEYWA